jgi:hypothetical protein
MITKKAKR